MAASVALAMVGERWALGALSSRGSRPRAQNGGSPRLLSGSVAIARCSSVMPLTPSISEWCILMNSAKRSSAKPSISVHSQGGRLRSSGVLCSLPISSPSSRSPPGQGRAAWRTWYSRSMCSSSTHDGTGFLLKASLSLRFQGALKLRWPRKSAISWRMKSRGASGGRRNCSKPPTWLGVARDSVNSHAASSGLSRTAALMPRPCGRALPCAAPWPALP